jgi:hypothetical protein
LINRSSALRATNALTDYSSQAPSPLLPMNFVLCSCGEAMRRRCYDEQHLRALLCRSRLEVRHSPAPLLNGAGKRTRVGCSGLSRHEISMKRKCGNQICVIYAHRLHIAYYQRWTDSQRLKGCKPCWNLGAFSIRPEDPRDCLLAMRSGKNYQEKVCRTTPRMLAMVHHRSKRFE